jgi:hypothetical protein
MTARSVLSSPRLRAIATGNRGRIAATAGSDVDPDRAETDAMIAAIRGLPRGRTDGPSEVPGPKCELCAGPMGERHRHLADLEARGIRCVCRACSVLFDRREAGGGRYRLVPDRLLALAEFELPDPLWQNLRIPVDMAFFFHNSEAGRVVAFYPGPMGAIESQLELDSWTRLRERNTVLHTLEPDVEALLVDRTNGGQRYWLVPIDVCYELVAVIRENWKGLAGGHEVWERLALFFDDLAQRARVVTTRERHSGRDASAERGVI